MKKKIELKKVLDNVLTKLCHYHLYKGIKVLCMYKRGLNNMQKKQTHF